MKTLSNSYLQIGFERFQFASLQSAPTGGQMETKRAYRGRMETKRACRGTDGDKARLPVS